MKISLEFLVEKQIFEGLKVIAGRDGLARPIKRVSVYDCPFMPSIISEGIIEKGDIFISCLEQFRNNPEDIKPFISFLAEKESSGLFVVGKECIHVLSEDIVDMCDKKSFPIVFSEADIPYAIIIDSVNKHIAIDNNNTLNNLKMEKILQGYMSAQETLATVYSINSNLESFVKVLFIEGDFTSSIDKVALQKKYLSNKNTMLIIGEQYIVLFLSGKDEKSLDNQFNFSISELKKYLDNFKAGIGRVHPIDQVKKSIEESRDAFFIAKSTNMDIMNYQPLSSYNLLLYARKSQEAYDFYEEFLEQVGKSTSSENLQEILSTIEAYVRNGGDFSKTAKSIIQHENTVRYRINKVRSTLKMENDNIRFFETLSIAIKLKQILNK